MPVLVTGATGHLGANLIRALLAEGRSIRALIHKDQRALEGLDVETLVGDIRDPLSCAEACRRCDVVYHLAAHISLRMDDWDRLYTINVLGTRYLVQACLDQGVRRLIHFSSIHALQPTPLDVPIDDARPLVSSPRAPPYDRSKAAAEMEVTSAMERGLDAVILRPTGVIGPHDYKPSHFGEVLRSLCLGRLPVLVEGGFDWVDARDVCQAAIQAEALAPAGARYMLPGHWGSIREVSNLVGEIAGVRQPRLAVPLWLARLGLPLSPILHHLDEGRPLYTQASLLSLQSYRNVSREKAARQLGHNPRSLEETLRDTIRWFHDQGHLTPLPSTPSPEDL